MKIINLIIFAILFIAGLYFSLFAIFNANLLALAVAILMFYLSFSVNVL